MFRRKLCPRCKTGKYTYELDRTSPECPYLGCYKGRKCAMYVKLDKPRKHGFFRSRRAKGAITPPPPRKIEV